MLNTLATRGFVIRERVFYASLGDRRGFLTYRLSDTGWREVLRDV